jgi:FlaA1/EpsC-like NDP-sugar epimerase
MSNALRGPYTRAPVNDFVEIDMAGPSGLHRSEVPRNVVRRVRRDAPLVLLDLAIVFSAYLSTLVVRLEGAVPPMYWRNFWIYLPLIVGIHLAANHLFGLYGQMWRYASVLEARRVVLAGLTAGGFIVAAVALPTRYLRPLPLAVPVFGALLSLIGFGAVRFQSRLFAFRRREFIGDRVRVLVVGAGDAGAMVLKDILENPSVGLHAVGVVDDDRRKIGRALYEVRVMGTHGDIPALVERLEVDQVLLAIPSASSDLIQEVAALSEQAGVTLRVLPSVRDIVGGRITARDIRDLRIEDLLGRQQVETDLEAVGAIIAGRRVLVTGAGGSIGTEIVRQVIGFSPAEMILLDHDETHLHDAVVGLSGDVPVQTVLADVRDRDRVFDAFIRYRPELVFHAAAHKHVPILEAYPEEAVQTNVLGTAHVVDAAVATGVQRFVLISTDKAVRPVSVMGASKWFAEQIVRSAQGRGCVFCAVRFGNVVGSRGSVIPTFLQQIERGGPVTVTDPDMARFFMSIQEAVQLVLQATALSEGGEVLTLEMGMPVNIMDLARRIIRLSGRVPGRDVKIEIVGQRPGEKLVEDIVDPDEEPVPTAYPGIAVSRPPVPDTPMLHSAIAQLEELVRSGDRDEVGATMKSFARPALQPLGKVAEG